MGSGPRQRTEALGPQIFAECLCWRFRGPEGKCCVDPMSSAAVLLVWFLLRTQRSMKPRARACSLQSMGRSRKRVRRLVVSSMGCSPRRMADTIFGDRKANGSCRLTSLAGSASRAAMSLIEGMALDRSASNQARALAMVFTRRRSSLASDGGRVVVQRKLPLSLRLSVFFI